MRITQAPARWAWTASNGPNTHRINTSSWNSNVKVLTAFILVCEFCCCRFIGYTSEKAQNNNNDFFHSVFHLYFGNIEKILNIFFVLVFLRSLVVFLQTVAAMWCTHMFASIHLVHVSWLRLSFNLAPSLSFCVCNNSHVPDASIGWQYTKKKNKIETMPLFLILRYKRLLLIWRRMGNIYEIW